MRNEYSVNEKINVYNQLSKIFRQTHGGRRDVGKNVTSVEVKFITETNCFSCKTVSYN